MLLPPSQIRCAPFIGTPPDRFDAPARDGVPQWDLA